MIKTNKMTIDEIAERLADLEVRAKQGEDRAQNSESQLSRTRRQMRVTWAVSTLAAVAMLSIGWHKDAIAQGYGITLAQAATRIAALETKTQDMTRITDPNTGELTVRFTGVNVQIVSGAGSTNGTINGAGNLIVGYNETRVSAGGSDDLRTGSHNLIVGPYNDYSGAGGAVIGFASGISNLEACAIGNSNGAYADYASAFGGYLNIATGRYASAVGGYRNSARGNYSTVSGGQNNVAGGVTTSGSTTTRFGDYSTVAGGANRSTTTTNQWVGGSYTSAQ